jgi:hypothetical protein
LTEGAEKIGRGRVALRAPKGGRGLEWRRAGVRAKILRAITGADCVNAVESGPEQRERESAARWGAKSGRESKTQTRCEMQRPRTRSPAPPGKRKHWVPPIPVGHEREDFGVEGLEVVEPEERERELNGDDVNQAWL